MSWPVALRSFEPSCPCCVCVMRQVALSYTSCTVRARQQVAEPAYIGFLQSVWGSFMTLARTLPRPPARPPARLRPCTLASLTLACWPARTLSYARTLARTHSHMSYCMLLVAFASPAFGCLSAAAWLDRVSCPFRGLPGKGRRRWLHLKPRRFLNLRHPIGDLCLLTNTCCGRGSVPLKSIMGEAMGRCKL